MGGEARLLTFIHKKPWMYADVDFNHEIVLSVSSLGLPFVAKMHLVSKHLCNVSQGHCIQMHGPYPASLTGTAKRLKTVLANALSRFAGSDQRLARVELGRLLRKGLAHGTGHGQTDVRVNIHLAYAVANAALNLFHRHTIGFFDVATKLPDDGQPFLWHAA